MVSNTVIYYMFIRCYLTLIPQLHHFTIILDNLVMGYGSYSKSYPIFDARKNNSSYGHYFVNKILREDKKLVILLGSIPV